MRRPPRLPAIALALALATLGASACGGQDSSTTTSEPAVCQDVDAIRASFQKMKDAKIGENALPVLRTELQKIQDRVQQIPADARQQYSTQIDAVKTADASLRSSIAAAKANPSGAALAAVATGLKTVGAAVQDLADAVKSTC